MSAVSLEKPGLHPLKMQSVGGMDAFRSMAAFQIGGTGVPLPEDECMSEQELMGAIDFFNRAHEQLEPSTFETVLEILRTGSRDPLECYRRVSEVLSNFRDLRDKCRSFFKLGLGPSYKPLSEVRRMRMSSKTSEIGAQVLNIDVSLKSLPAPDSSRERSGDSCVNQYRNKLFHCEDKHFEMDMIIETARAAITRMEEFPQGGDIAEHLTGADLRCIEQIYGEAGLDVVNLLQENPAKVLPVVLGRLKQKEDEWVKCRWDMSNRWKQACAENSYPSLGYPRRPC